MLSTQKTWRQSGYVGHRARKQTTGGKRDGFSDRGAWVVKSIMYGLKIGEFSSFTHVITGCLHLVNVQPLFHTHPPLQPERLEPGGSNLVWTHLVRMLEDSSRQFSIRSLGADIFFKN